MQGHSKRYLFLIMIPAFVFLTLFMYYPIIRGVVIAFQDYTLFDMTNIQFIGLANFRAIISDINFRFRQILINTLLWIVVSLFFQLCWVLFWHS